MKELKFIHITKTAGTSIEEIAKENVLMKEDEILEALKCLGIPF